MIISLFRIFCIQLLLVGAGAWAQETPTESPVESEILQEEERPTYEFKNEFMRMLFILGLLIAGFVGTMWMIKRISKGRARIYNNSSSIRILETRRLSQKSFVHLIEVEEIKVLVGDSANGLTPLGTLSSPEKSPSEPPFSTILRKKLDGVACQEKK